MFRKTKQRLCKCNSRKGHVASNDGQILQHFCNNQVQHQSCASGFRIMKNVPSIKDRGIFLWVTESRWSPACGRFSLGGCCLNLSVKPIFCWRCQSCRKSVRKSCRQGVEPAIKAIWYQLWNYMFGVWAPSNLVIPWSRVSPLLPNLFFWNENAHFMLEICNPLFDSIRGYN